MHRTQGEDYVVEDGKRRYRPASPPSIPATRFPAESANSFQEEIASVIEYAGITLAATAEEDRASGWTQLRDAIFKSNKIGDEGLIENNVVISKQEQTLDNVDSFTRTGEYTVTIPTAGLPDFENQVTHTAVLGILNVFNGTDFSGSTFIFQKLTIIQTLNGTARLPEHRVYTRAFVNGGVSSAWRPWSMETDGSCKSFKASTQIDLDAFVARGVWRIRSWVGSFITPPAITSGANAIIMRVTDNASDGVIQEILCSLKLTPYDEQAYNDYWRRVLIKKLDYTIGENPYYTSAWTH